jgi:hypothetical protein
VPNDTVAELLRKALKVLDSTDERLMAGSSTTLEF